MKFLLMLIIMFALHVIADFNLQGILAKMKQKAWWERRVKNLDSSMYKNDYKVSLAIHSFIWSFIVMLPMLICKWEDICMEFDWRSIRTFLLYILLLAAGAFFHYAVDDVKANDKDIPLSSDQLLHGFQITFVWLFWTVFIGW